MVDFKQFSNVAFGTLWFLDTNNGLPPSCHARIKNNFEELNVAETDNLATVMNPPSSKLVRRRLQGGSRCFVIKVDSQIAAYGWVTQGPQIVGELEREFKFRSDEAYVWDCSTMPAWQRLRLYSALLSQIIYRLYSEGVARIWIGASRQNQASIKGIKNAGFRHVVNLLYRRFYRLTILWFQEPSSSPAGLIPAAYSILLKDYEYRFGRLVVGWYPSSINWQ
jgi:GNAT superfamily N-acetyltransferase